MSAAKIKDHFWIVSSSEQVQKAHLPKSNPLKKVINKFMENNLWGGVISDKGVDYVLVACNGCEKCQDIDE